MARRNRRLSVKGPRTPRPDLISQNVLGEACWSWPCPFSTVSSGASLRSFASIGWTRYPRTLRSSYSATSWPCCTARSPVPASLGPTGPSLPSWPVLFLENTGDRCSSAHRRSWAGTARWSRSSDLAAPPTRSSWSCQRDRGADLRVGSIYSFSALTRSFTGRQRVGTTIGETGGSRPRRGAYLSCHRTASFSRSRKSIGASSIWTQQPLVGSHHRAPRQPWSWHLRRPLATVRAHRLD